MIHSLASTVSLLHGWLPVAVQVLAVTILVLALGRRSRRWNLWWLPVSLLTGAAVVLSIHWYVGYQGWSDDPAPPGFWIWIALTWLAGVVLLAGWRGTRWWQRTASVLAVPLCFLCVAMALNLWVGYLPTVSTAWDRLTGTPLGGRIDMATLREMQRKGTVPANGTIVSVEIPADASGFKHRNELVYLPPAWYATNPPPRLPVVMMIGGEFGSPSAWPTAGAQKVLDDFAADHGGNAPVVVFVDHGGTFRNDTECVNGTRGNSADHLTKDVVPYMVSDFDVSSDPAHWGVVGWSAGGTCALTLTVKYPEVFRAFVDIDGQIGPNAGTKQQTIYRLFDGDTRAWAAFDPKTVMAEHGPYQGISGWFAVSDPTPPVFRAGTAHPGAGDMAEPDLSKGLEYATAAQYMCALASSYGIQCAVVPQPSDHDFPSAVNMFSSALPWLAGKLGTPGVPVVLMPGVPTH